MDENAASEAVPGQGDGADQPTDALLAVRSAIETVEELPVADRADVFEQVHQVVVEELRQLELG